jgi:hypothetical protein
LKEKAEGAYETGSKKWNFIFFRFSKKYFSFFR